MFCYVCKQRWAPLEWLGQLLKKTDEEREKAFESNEIRCCGSDDCLKEVDLKLQSDDIDWGNRQIEEVKEYLKKNPTANKMEI